MEYEVRITLQAQAHLREIRDYIAQKLLAPEAAKSTVQRLGTVMASLSQMPKRVPLIEEEPGIQRAFGSELSGTFLYTSG